MTQLARNNKSEFSQHKSNRFDSDFLFRAACVTNKKNRFSCIARLKIHYQLENRRKQLFSTELVLHWEIFCCTTSYDYIARIEDGEERCKYFALHSFCFFPSLLSSELILFFTEPKLTALPPYCDVSVSNIIESVSW